MTIREIADRTGLSTYTLRYYEDKGLLKVKRDTGGRRVYEEEDIAWIQFIQRLKDTGMRLRDIQTYAQLRYLGDTTMKDRLQLLKKHKVFVEEEQRKWKDYLESLEDKIAYYEKELSR